MAVGQNVNLTNNASVNNQLAADAANIQQFILWAQRKYNQYNANLSTTTQQQAAGFSAAGDQATITSFIGDLNRIQTWLTGGTGIALGENVLNDMNALLGIS